MLGKLSAMHGSDNQIFVASVPEAMCADIEQELIWHLRQSLLYNVQGKSEVHTSHVRLTHQGELPAF
jgi:hypothetical protein